MEVTFTIDTQVVKQDLVRGIRECTERGLHHSAKWLSELNYALKDVQVPPQEVVPPYQEEGDELDMYLLAKSYFDLKEYDRCSFFTKDCSTPKCKFLYFYSQYLSIEKKKLDNMTDAELPDKAKNSALKELNQVIQAEYFEKNLDGYCLYLYGIILRRLELNVLATDIFVEAVNATPLHWGAWQELAPLILNSGQLKSLNLPDHWMKQFFMAHAYLEQLANDEALAIYKNLYNQGFSKSSFIKAQTATVYHNRRGKKDFFTFKLLI